MSRMLVRSLAACAVGCAAILCVTGTASALSKPIRIGSNTTGLPSVPAVAVDSAGTLVAAWLDGPADTTLTFCKVAVGSTACSPVKITVPDPSHAQFFDPPSVLVSGTDVYIFAEVDGAADLHHVGYDEWLSTDGGATFSMIPNAVSWTGIGDTAGAGKMPAFPLPGGSFGIGEVSAVSNPLVQANSLASPADYSQATLPTPYAKLSAGYSIGNLGGQFASQLSGSTGVLGVFELLEAGPCPTTSGLVFSWAGVTSATTNAELNTSSSWSPLAKVDCNAEYPAVGGGPSGLGVLFTSGKGIRGVTQYRKFTAPGTFAPAATVAGGTALQPSLSQDGAGGIFATWLTNGVGLRLAYSSDGGLGWEGERTIAPSSTRVSVDSTMSAVGPSGQGWAVYASNGGEYAVAGGTALQPSLSQDGAGGIFATWITNGVGLRLAYSSDGGLGWEGERTIAPSSTRVSVDSTMSAVGPSGQGWAVYASNGGEYAVAFDAADADVTPVDRNLSVKPRSFASGATIRYFATEAATTTFEVFARGQTTPIGSFTHVDLNGPVSIPFPSTIGGHALAAGHYRLEATPKLGSMVGKPAKAGFTIT